LQLDVAGAIEDTDKCSGRPYGQGWGYLDHYQQVFEPLRRETFNLLEIGAKGGASLRLWKNYFENATVVGIDIDERCRSLADERIVIEIGNQADADFTRAVGERYLPKIIIDDGSHQAEHIVSSFEKLYHYLAPGGYYIIEDTSFHFNGTAEWNKSRSIPIDYYFLTIAKSLMARRWLADAGPPKLAQLFREIASVSFIPGAIIVRKRPQKAPTSEIVAVAERYLHERDARSATDHVRLAGYALRSAGAASVAQEQVEKALELDPDCAGAYHVRAQIRDEEGKPQQALDAASSAAAMDGTNALHWLQKGQLQLRVRDTMGAIASLERAAALKPRDQRIATLLARARKQRGT
jgi:tetratricopeptide (TPR) repeat protein